jgi:cellulose biosynthesis protein BcsQ
MNILLMNFTGNVGKSTLSKHLFFPRLDNADIISFESINAHNNEGEQLRGEDFGSLIKALPIYDNAIIDVGSSNVESFIGLMEAYKRSHEWFDYFIVPTTSTEKQIKDTISTIFTLNRLGVPSEKIIVVFNMVGRNDNIEKKFLDIFNYHKAKKSFNLKPDAVIHESDLFASIKDTKLTVDDLVNDKTDYRAAIKATQDIDERVRLMEILTNRMLAETVKEELDAVFNSIIGVEQVG